MARLNLRLDAFYMDADAVSDEIKKVVRLVEQITQINDFMSRKITAVHDRFKSRNYDRITEALDSCKGKLEKAQEEFNELLDSCNQLSEKINNIEG